MTPRGIRSLKWAAYYREHRERILERQRERYRQDAKHRKRKLKQANQRYAKRVRPSEL